MLLRTIHSILDRSSPWLLKQVILVDDGSTIEYLMDTLEEYVALLENVRIERLGERKGLVQGNFKSIISIHARDV